MPVLLLLLLLLLPQDEAQVLRLQEDFLQQPRLPRLNGFKHMATISTMMAAKTKSPNAIDPQPPKNDDIERRALNHSPPTPYPLAR